MNGIGGNRGPGPRAVFLDRDGTLMEEVQYCCTPANVRVYAGVPNALRDLREAGFLNIIVTNQSGIGRKLFSDADYRAVHDELLHQLRPGAIDATYYCPDAPGIPSSCRKPAPGMVLQAARDYNIDLSRSFFIGDKAADIACGRNAGTKTVLVLSGYGREQNCTPDFIAADFPAAARLILENCATE
jgi:D-glycero-D-manno-heptose 1,7-bisphosphate phosphatase